MWFWSFHLNAEGIISHESQLWDKDEPAATDLKISQLTQYNTDVLWTITDKICVYRDGVLVYALNCKRPHKLLTCYCNQVCKCKTVSLAIFWQVDNIKALLVICQSSVNTSDVRIEIQNDAGLSSSSQQGKPNNNSRLKSSSTFSSVRVFKIYWRNNVLAVLVTWSIKINTYKCIQSEQVCWYYLFSQGENSINKKIN